MYYIPCIQKYPFGYQFGSGYPQYFKIRTAQVIIFSCSVLEQIILVQYSSVNFAQANLSYAMIIRNDFYSTVTSDTN